MILDIYFHEYPSTYIMYNNKNATLQDQINLVHVIGVLIPIQYTQSVLECIYDYTDTVVKSRRRCVHMTEESSRNLYKRVHEIPLLTWTRTRGNTRCKASGSSSSSSSSVGRSQRYVSGTSVDRELPEEAALYVKRFRGECDERGMWENINIMNNYRWRMSPFARVEEQWHSGPSSSKETI